MSACRAGLAYNQGITHGLLLAGTVSRAFGSLCNPLNHPEGEIHFTDEETENLKQLLTYSRIHSW